MYENTVFTHIPTVQKENHLLRVSESITFLKNYPKTYLHIYLYNNNNNNDNLM